MLTVVYPYQIRAEDTFYDYHCGGNYEVSTVNDDGSFAKVGCYGTFSAAKEAMKNSGDDAVVRHANSLSPTKIIAMNYGIAMSYPKRNGEVTLTLTQNIDGTGKTTYVTSHRELTKATTETYNGNGDGKVLVYLNGFEGYTSLKQVDLIPMKYIEKGIALYLGGNDITKSKEAPFKTNINHS